MFNKCKTMVQNLISQVSLALPTIINQMISKRLMLFSNFGLIDLQLMPLAVFNKIGTLLRMIFKVLFRPCIEF